MRLAPSDTEKLLLAVAGMVARNRLGRGMKLNYPRVVGLRTSTFMRTMVTTRLEVTGRDGRLALRSTAESY